MALNSYIPQSTTQSPNATVWTCPDQQVFNPPSVKSGVTTYYPQLSYIMNVYLVGSGAVFDGTTSEGTVVDPDSYYSRASDDALPCFGFNTVKASMRTSNCTPEVLAYDDLPIEASHIADPDKTDLMYESLYEDLSTGPSYEGTPPTVGDWTVAPGYWAATGTAGELVHWFSANSGPGVGVARHGGGVNNYLFCEAMLSRSTLRCRATTLRKTCRTISG